MITSPLFLRALSIALLAALVSPSSARGEEEAAFGKEEEQQEPQFVGFELGDFHIKDFRATQGEKVRITFTLHASTPADEARSFAKKLEQRRMRLRDQVITAMRLANPLEFEDPELRLIRRRLFLRLGRALPDLKIEDLYFSDFRYLVN